MRRILPLIFIVLLLTGCNDSDSGSAIGGSGSADCQILAGSYDLGDGAKMKIRSDCTFTIWTRDGVAVGRISSPNDSFISIDIEITQGAGFGCRGTLNIWIKDGVVTKTEFKDYCT